MRPTERRLPPVVYNKSTKQFDYTAGQDGKGPDINVVNAAVKEAVATPGENATVPGQATDRQRIRLMTRAHSKHSLTPMPGLASN